MAHSASPKGEPRASAGRSTFTTGSSLSMSMTISSPPATHDRTRSESAISLRTVRPSCSCSFGGYPNLFAVDRYDHSWVCKGQEPEPSYRMGVPVLGYRHLSNRCALCRPSPQLRHLRLSRNPYTSRRHRECMVACRYVIHCKSPSASVISFVPPTDTAAPTRGVFPVP